MNESVLFNAYLTGIDSLLQVIDGLSPVQMRAHPVPGTWSVLEVLCHLADSEALFADRMKRVLAEDRPALLFADPSQHAAALAYQARDAAEEVAMVDLIRRQMGRILKEQPMDAWSRVGVHSKEGDRTLEQLVRKAVEHLEHHLAFIKTKCELLRSECFRTASCQAFPVRKGIRSDQSFDLCIQDAKIEK